MKFEQLYSGSGGNLYVATSNNGNRILIECGVSWKKFLKALNYDLTGIAGCLISHCHKDHCKSAHELIKAGITIYASEGTLAALDLTGKRRTVAIKNRDLIRDIGDFDVFVFDTEHDAPDPLGFIVRENLSDEHLLFATDTSHIQYRFNIKFSLIAIELSYDREILYDRLKSGDIHEALAKRLLTSHFEKRNAIQYLKDFCDLSRCREIHLIHCSEDNLDIEQTQIEIEKQFFIKTIAVKQEGK